MQPSFDHLPSHKLNQLKEISGSITKTVDLQKVIFFETRVLEFKNLIDLFKPKLTTKDYKGRS